MKKITLLLLFVGVYAFAQVPTSNPTSPPSRNVGDVISFYGGDDNSYSNVSGVDFKPYWNQLTPPWVAPDTEFDISGNNVMKYTAFGYQGVEFSGSPKNVEGMEFLHIDIWTNSSSPNLHLLSPGSGDYAYNFPAKAGDWTSVDIPLSFFDGNANLNLANLAQMKFDGGNGDDIYIDNIYFWKNPQDASTDATLSEIQIDGNVLEGFSAATTSYTVELTVGTTTAPSITSVTTTQAGASASINQAQNVPGAATITVTASNGNNTETYTVSFTATLPGSAGDIASPPSETLALMDNIADTGNATNFWNPSYFFGTSQGVIDLEGNSAVKMDFSVAGWGGGINNGSDVYTDVSSYGFINFSYYAPSGAAGVNGHEFYFDLIGGGASPSGNGAGEFFYTLKEAGQGGDGDIVFDSWQNVSVPLSFFVNKGWSLDNFFQFKLGSPSDLNTKVVYFDNIFFSVNAGVLGVENNELLGFSMYPNPANNMLNISAKETIKNADIFNVLGKRVMSVTINKTNDAINVSDLASGIYLIKYTVNDKVGTAKFIKQ